MKISRGRRVRDAANLIGDAGSTRLHQVHHELNNWDNIARKIVGLRRDVKWVCRGFATNIC